MINCGLLRVGADCSERYFKNKDEDYRFWMKFAQFTVLICKKLSVRARSVMCFLLDNIAV